MWAVASQQAITFKEVNMTRPIVKPIRPEFSSGPCAKRPDWSLQVLKNSCLGRSHRHPVAKNKLNKAIELTKNLLEIPDDYLVGIVPGSDTGAIEMAMWNLLGPMDVTILVWDSFGQDWSNDVKSQLQLMNIEIKKADYGKLPEPKDLRNDLPKNETDDKDVQTSLIKNGVLKNKTLKNSEPSALEKSVLKKIK